MNLTEEQKIADIKEIQRYLRAIARTNENIPMVIPNGVYDDDTTAAVRAFQQQYGLPVTGKVDLETWDQIYSVFRAVEAYFAALEEISPVSNRLTVLERGDAGYLIYIIQAMFNTIAQFYDNLNGPPITGIFDKDTEDFVKQIQAIVGIEPTGKLDNDTWNKLARLYNFTAVIDERDYTDETNIPQAEFTPQPQAQERAFTQHPTANQMKFVG